MTDEAILRRIEDDLKWSEAAYDEAWQAMVDIRLSDDIARLQVPTLMIAGDRDGLRAANLADAQRIPNCALHVFYRVGHEVAADVPDEFMALLDDFIRHGVAPAVSWEQRRAMLQDLLRAQTTPA
jgi:pimeloyl-ACP methyl ester carboxylesterase